jgi:hypothetical protein
MIHLICVMFDDVFRIFIACASYILLPLFNFIIFRSIKYLNFMLPEKYHTHSYFKKIEANFWQLKYYLNFQLKNNEIKSFLNLILQYSIKKVLSSITSLCKKLLKICKTFESSVVRQSCK